MLKKALKNLVLRTSFALHMSSRSLVTTTTIDDNEVQHFKKLLLDWWDETGDAKVLHSMNVLRVPFIRDSLINSGVAKKVFINSSEPLTGLQILDVGCGPGLVSEPLARLGCNVIGIDAASELIDTAKEHAAQDKKLNNLSYITSSIEEFSQRNSETFDAVVASEVIEHVNDASMFVKGCVKCLKPGGSICITTISKTFLAEIATIYLSENILGIIPVGTHQYEKLIEPHTVQKLLEDSNCCTKVIHGMFYNYFTNTWSWIGDASNFYALHAIKMVP